MLDRLSIRSKIALILIVPVIACAVLGALRVGSRISTSRQADRVSKLTEFSLSGTHVAHELQQERGLSARYLWVRSSAAPANAMLAQRPKTDTALKAFRDKVDKLDANALAPSARDKLSATLGQLSGLPNLRRDIDERSVAASAAMEGFEASIEGVLDTNRELAESITDGELAQSVGAFVALSGIRELASEERELISGVLARGRFQAGEYRTFTSMLATRAVLLSEFRSTTTPAQRATYSQSVVGPEVQRASELENAVVATEGSRAPAIDLDQWFKVTTTNLLLMHGVEQGFGGAAVARSQAIERDANQRAVVDSLFVLLAVALAVTLSLMVARSMLRPLRLLEATAKDVAINRLPGVVAKLQRSPTQQSLHLAEELEPVEVPSRDEIGEVANAFNAVHQVALRVAAEQAALRTSIGEMFLNLARRSQSLIDRQIELIDDLEEEADAQTLRNLFQLDHLATRMRRNAENLIVLSGAEPPRRWAEPIPLPEIVRGAVAEVEDYQRVALLPIEELGVPGRAASDLIHLLAELIENATSFSPPGTAVRIGGQRAANGYVVEVEDRGLGMNDDELLAANQRLANPPAIDFAVSRMLGLFVVGRLAQRYGIRVQLRHSSYGGVTALVLLPSTILIQLEPEPAALPSEGSQLAVSAPLPTRPVRVQPTPAPGRRPAVRAEASAPPATAPPRPVQDEPALAPEPTPGPARPWPAAGEPPVHAQRPPLAAEPPRPPAPPPPPVYADPVPPVPPVPPRPAPEEPAPAHAEPLPIFEQARSEWFDSSSAISAEHGPPRHQGAYPPLAARFQTPSQRGPVGEGPSGAPGWASAQPPRPSRAVDDAASDAPQRLRNGFASESAPLDADPAWYDPQAAEPAAGRTPNGPAPAVQQETPAGLPRRVPRANLAPGILEQRERVASGPPPGGQSQRLRSPEEVRSLLATYRAGLQRGRQSAASGEAADFQSATDRRPPGPGGEDDEAL